MMPQVSFAVKLLLVSLALFTYQSGFTQELSVDQIDSLAVSSENIIKDSLRTKMYHVREKHDFIEYIPEMYFIDSLTNKLLKVVAKESVVDTLPAYKSRKDGKQIHPTVRDTLLTSFYFLNESLVKVAQQNAQSDFYLEFYFKNTQVLQKIVTVHGRAFLITEESLSESFLKKASKYITNYKSISQ